MDGIPANLSVSCCGCRAGLFWIDISIACQIYPGDHLAHTGRYRYIDSDPDPNGVGCGCPICKEYDAVRYHPGITTDDGCRSTRERQGYRRHDIGYTHA